MMRFVWSVFVLFPACTEGSDSDGGSIEGDDAFECSDGADNDLDGSFDCDDSGCTGSPDCETETDSDADTDADSDADSDSDDTDTNADTSDSDTSDTDPVTSLLAGPTHWTGQISLYYYMEPYGTQLACPGTIDLTFHDGTGEGTWECDGTDQWWSIGIGTVTDTGFGATLHYSSFSCDMYGLLGTDGHLTGGMPNDLTPGATCWGSGLSGTFDATLVP